MHSFVAVALEFIQICPGGHFLSCRLDTPHPPKVDLQQVSRSTSVIPFCPPQRSVDLLRLGGDVCLTGRPRRRYRETSLTSISDECLL